MLLKKALRKSFARCLISLIVILLMVPYQAHANHTKPLKIVVSFSILFDFTKKITAGVPSIEIKSIVPLMEDPHTYQPKPNDSKALANADIVFVNGLGFEEWIDRLIKASGFKGQIIIAAQNATPRHDLQDPHAWHDIKNAISYVQTITKALCDHDPNNAPTYKKNCTLYLDKLKKLEKYIHTKLSKVPKSKRIVVTTHDAFWYFGNTYHIKFLSPIGVSTDAEPTANDVARLIDMIKSKNLQAIFIENLANKRLIEEIAKETGKSLQGTLYADSLSDEKGPAPTYIHMVKHNVDMLTAAFNGQ